MSAPPPVFAGTLTAKNHPAEAHRQNKRGPTDLYLQCRGCGATGTLHEREGGVNGLPVVDGRQAMINAAWAKCRKAIQAGDQDLERRCERFVRDLRYGKPFLIHADCGGVLQAFDIRSADG